MAISSMLLNLIDLHKKYNLQIIGLIHIGAHKAEEYKVYKRLDIKNVVWVEANEDLIPVIKKVIGNQTVINAVISDCEKQVIYYKCSLTGSNSILEPNLNLKWRNDLYLKQKVSKNAIPLKQLQTNENFLYMDTQGSELDILKGSDLSKIDYIYTEVHKVQTYKNCPHVNDIDKYLTDYNRAETVWTRDRWGDAFYIKK